MKAVGRAARRKRRVEAARAMARLLDKPIHKVSGEDLDRIIESTFNAKPIKPKHLDRNEIYRKAMLLGVDPCDLVEAETLPECLED